MPPPPPLGGARPPGSKLPPPPPLPGRGMTSTPTASTAGATWKSPPEVLAMMVEFVPTFFVPANSVASILDDNARDFIKNKMKFVMFLKKYRFYFDLRNADGVRIEVKLRDDVVHPRKGVADDKFTLTDIGDFASYNVKPEFVQTLDNIDNKADVVVQVRPVQPPPAVHVRLEERVPVLERLKELIPATEFAPIEDIDEKIPDDVLFHPYFDCQGGLVAIAAKFPEHFQVVDGMIRQRQAALAPLALHDFTFETSPEQDIITRIQAAVCAHDIPVWIGVTSLYEQLSVEERRAVKRGFKSFAGFLRAHGRSLAVSTDLLKVSHWIPPKDAPKLDAAPGTTTTVQYTHTHIANELFDKLPRNKELTLAEVMTFVPDEMKSSLPKNFVGWLAAQRSYFIVDNADLTPPDVSMVRVRRASDHAALDIAVALYKHIPEDGIAVKALMKEVPASLAKTIEQLGMQSICDNLSEWVELLDGDVFTLKSVDELNKAVAGSRAKPVADDADDEVMSDEASFGDGAGDDAVSYTDSTPTVAKGGLWKPRQGDNGHRPAPAEGGSGFKPRNRGRWQAAQPAS